MLLIFPRILTNKVVHFDIPTYDIVDQIIDKLKTLENMTLENINLTQVMNILTEVSTQSKTLLDFIRSDKNKSKLYY